MSSAKKRILRHLKTNNKYCHNSLNNLIDGTWMPEAPQYGGGHASYKVCVLCHSVKDGGFVLEEVWWRVKLFDETFVQNNHSVTQNIYFRKPSVIKKYSTVVTV